MKVVPLGANVVVKRLAAEEEDGRRHRLARRRQGEAAPGPRVVGRRRPIASDGSRVRHQVSEGDRVLFGSYAGAEVVVNGEELLIMSEDEILAVVP